MKQWILDNKHWLLPIGVIILIVLIVGVYISIPKDTPIDTQQAVNEAREVLEEQYAQQLSEKDIVIKEYQTKLLASEAKYSTLVRKYSNLQKEKENVKLSVTNEELRSRFTALGYPPLPAK